ncbi:MAG TPA: ATP-binding protein [Drouetiella sp.]|jgi:uncharacterized protein
MTKAALVFDENERLGRVSMVDTGRVFIDVENHSLLTRLSVGNLIALQGQTQQEYLVGIVERITRSTQEELLEGEEDDEGHISVGQSLEDTVRAVVVGTYRIVDGEKSNVFKRGADSFPQIDRECYVIIGKNLQSLMNLLSKDVKDTEKLQLGRFVADRTALAVASGDRFFQRHASVLGSTGSGKSWAVALILEKASQLPHVNIIVLDMHGEYAPLSKGPGRIADYFKIAGPGDLDKTPPEAVFLPYWLLNRDEMISMFVDRSDQNAPNQSSRFTLHVQELKEEYLKTQKKSEVLATFTVDSPVPYDLNKLMECLRKDNSQMVQGKSGEKQGEWFGKLTRFISRLEAKMADRRYGFLFQPPGTCMSYDWLSTFVGQLMLSARKDSRGIKIVDFSEVPPDVLPVVAGVFARLLYDVQFWMQGSRRTPIAIVCDEAHIYLPVRDDADSVEKRALAVFETIAKEGRKYGVSLLVVSQRPSDVSRTILSQCNNFLVLRLTNGDDQSVVRHLVPESMVGMTDVLPLLDTGEAILLGDAILIPSRIKLDVPTIKPDSATREFWTEWTTNASTEGALTDAVESLRRQSRVGSDDASAKS